MKKNLIKYTALAIFALSLGACSKNGDKKSNLVLLTQAAWKYQIAGFDADLNGSVDIESSFIEACDKDDVTTFKTDNTGTFDAGATKCDPSELQTESFDWQFKNGETEIFYDGDTYKILSIDDNTIKIYEDIVNAGQTIRYLLILKH